MDRDLARRRRELGFTLIELLTVISILGILASLCLQSLKVYRSSAAYGVANSSVRNARTALEATFNNPDVTFSPLAMTSQSTPGPLTNATARSVFPAFQVSRNTTFTAYFDPACLDSSCIAGFMQVQHCQGLKYLNYTRFGDGADILLENIDGGGC